MTGTVSYTSLEEFELDYKKTIAEELGEMTAERQWWNQPPALVDDPAKPYLLTGSNRILRRYLTLSDGQLRKVDYRDDLLMAMADYLAIVEMLTYLSAEHEFAWSFGYPAEPRHKEIGRIDDGEVSPRLFEFLVPEMEALEISDQDLENKRLQADLRAKYSLDAP